MPFPSPGPSRRSPACSTGIPAQGSPGPRWCGRTGRRSPRTAASPPSAGRSSGARRSARLRDPYTTQRSHYALDEDPTEPIEVDWMLGAFLLQRREMLDELGGWDAGFRHYVEDIDLAYRAMRAGWERWFVPAAVVRHAYAAVIDQRFLSRHTLWHCAGHGALRAQAPRDPHPAVSDKSTQYARKAEGWSDREYADPGAYLEHRAELVVSLGPRARGGRRGARPRLRRRGAWRAAARARASLPGCRCRAGDGRGRRAAALGERAAGRGRRPQHVRARRGRSRRSRCFAPSTTRPTGRAFFARARGFTSGKLVFDLNPRQFRARGRRRRPARGRVRAGRGAAVLHPTDGEAPSPARRCAPAAGAQRPACSARCCGGASRYLVAAW